MPDLTTLDNVAGVLNLDPATMTPGESAVLSRMITAYSAWFLSKVNRGALLSASYTEIRNGRASGSIVTKYFPITAVQSVGYTDGLTTYPATSGHHGYSFDDYRILMPGGFRRGRGNVVLSYTAGFLSVPPDIEEAIINQIVFMRKRMPTVDVTSNTAEGQVTMAFSTKELAPGVQGTIDDYKNNTVFCI